MVLDGGRWMKVGVATNLLSAADPSIRWLGKSAITLAGKMGPVQDQSDIPSSKVPSYAFRGNEGQQRVSYSFPATVTN